MSNRVLHGSRFKMGSVVLAAGMVLAPNFGSGDTPVSFSCQSPEPCFEYVVAQMQKGRRAAFPSVLQLEALLGQIQMVDKQNIWNKRAKLHVGYWLKNTSPEQARELLWVSLKEFPLLSDYIKIWIGETYLKTGHWKEAIAVLKGVVSGQRESLLQVKALYLTAEAMTRSGDCKKAAPVLLQAVSKEPRNERASWSVSQLGHCALQQGQRTLASNYFRQVWQEYPLSEESLQAETWFDQQKETILLPTDQETLEHAVMLYKKGAFHSAVNTLKSLVSRKLPDTRMHEAQYQLARSYVRLKRYESAEIILGSLAKSKSNRSDDALVLLGKVYLRQGKGEPLQKLTSRVTQKNLSRDQQARVLMYYGIWLENHDRFDEMNMTFRQSVKRAYSQSTRLSMLWRAGWSFYQQRAFQQAIEHFEDIVSLTQSLTSHSSVELFLKATYWMGRAQDQLGKHEKALSHFEHLGKFHPFTYYGMLASLRLGLSEPVPSSVLPVTSVGGDEAPSDIPDGEHYRKSIELATLRLEKEARQELEYLYRSHGSNETLYPLLVSLAQKIGAYDIGIRLAIRQHGKSLRNGGLPLSSKIWESAYPLGYRDLIQAMVPKHVDPYLVLGLIREESLYRVHAISSVGAIGLMQLMPYTAKRVGEQLGVEKPYYEGEGLFEPKHNIQLGAHYLGQLLQEFQNNIVFSVAAYNAGPSIVKEWVSRHGKRPPDEFVEFIGYRETQRYVKRVVRSYRIYQMVFENSCTNPSLDRFC